MVFASSSARYLLLLVPVVLLAAATLALWPRRGSRSAQLAIGSLALGLFGLGVCLLSPFAVFLGRRALAARSPSDNGVYLVSIAGIVLGAIGCVFLALMTMLAAIYLIAHLTGHSW
jgi:hypothetical protein